MSNLSKNNTQLASEQDSVLQQRLNTVTGGRPLVSLDLETECAVVGCADKNCRHGLSPYTNRITLIAVTSGTFRRVFTPETFRTAIFLPEIRLAAFVGHNLKFDFIQLRKHIPGFKEFFPLDRCFMADTMIMAHTHYRKVDPFWLTEYESERVSRNAAGEKHRKAGGLSLKTLAPFFLGVQKFWEVENKDNETYVLTDTLHTENLALHFLTHMSDDEFTFMQKRMIGWQRMLLLAEERGTLVDAVALAKLEEELQLKTTELKTKLDVLWADAHTFYRQEQETDIRVYYATMKNQKVATKNLPKALERLPKGFDYDSPKQMLWFLRDYRSFDITTFEGDESTGKGVLERLANEGHDDIKMFLEWRKAQKLLTAFIPTYKEYLEQDDAVHPSFHLCGTRTGRLSCSDPNVQQLPKEIKPLLKPRPGYKFATYDLAAIEAKLIAWFAEDPVLINIIQEGVSLHDYNVNVFFGFNEPLENIKNKYPMQRKAAKTCAFALLYGAGANRIRESFAQAGFIVSEGQAKNLLENFKRRYETAFKYHKQITRQFENFETILNAVGRPINIQSWDSAYMQGLNTLVQSSASDLNLLIAERALKNAAENGIEAHLLLLVHDSITFEVKEESMQIFVDNCLLPVYNELKLDTQYGTLQVTSEGSIQEQYE